MSESGELSFSSKKRMHPGFSVGLTCGAIAIAIHVVLLLLYNFTNGGDFLMFLIVQPIIYYFGGYLAAERLYQQHLLTHVIEPGKNLLGAAVGAAMLCCCSVWVYLIIRAFVRDAAGIYIVVTPLSLGLLIVVDGMLAIALGRRAGRNVERRYSGFQSN